MDLIALRPMQQKNARNRVLTLHLKKTALTFVEVFSPAPSPPPCFECRHHSDMDFSVRLPTAADETGLYTYIEADGAVCEYYCQSQCIRRALIDDGGSFENTIEVKLTIHRFTFIDGETDLSEAQIPWLEEPQRNCRNWFERAGLIVRGKPSTEQIMALCEPLRSYALALHKCIDCAPSELDIECQLPTQKLTHRQQLVLIACSLEEMHEYNGRHSEHCMWRKQMLQTFAFEMGLSVDTLQSAPLYVDNLKRDPFSRAIPHHNVTQAVDLLHWT